MCLELHATATPSWDVNLPRRTLGAAADNPVEGETCSVVYFSNRQRPLDVTWDRGILLDVSDLFRTYRT